MAEKYVVSILVQNNSGVLCRVAGLFSRRGYNISSLTVGETADPRFSRMTIETDGADHTLDQIKKQLAKLPEVVKIAELKHNSSVFRELMLVKVAAGKGTRAGLLEICNVFRAKIVDLGPSTATIQMTSVPSTNNSLLELLSEYGILEVARTGITGLMRGEPHLSIEGDPHATN